MFRTEPGVDSSQKNRDIWKNGANQREAPGNSRIPVGHPRGKAYQIRRGIPLESLEKLLFCEAEMIVVSGNISVGKRFFYLLPPWTEASPGKIFLPGLLKTIQKKNPVSPFPKGLKKIEKPQRFRPEIEKGKIPHRGVDSKNCGMPKIVEIPRIISHNAPPFFLLYQPKFSHTILSKITLCKNKNLPGVPKIPQETFKNPQKNLRVSEKTFGKVEKRP
jgi:hypothetical protein